MNCVIKIILSRSFALLYLSGIIAISIACKDDTPDPDPQPDILQLVSLKLGNQDLSQIITVEGLPTDQPVVARFNTPVSEDNLETAFILKDVTGAEVDLSFFLLDENQTVSAMPDAELEMDALYHVTLTDDIEGANGETFAGITMSFRTFREPLSLELVAIDTHNLMGTNRITDIPQDYSLQLQFSHPVDQVSLDEKLFLWNNNAALTYTITQQDAEGRMYEVTPEGPATHLAVQRMLISPSLKSVEGHDFDGFDKEFYTALDPTPKFPVVSDEELLTIVQEQTFKYFWDFGHPVSGLSRERNTSGQTVTSGGSGFGLMSIIVGIERGFITRQEGIDRINTTVQFLAQADRFHGMWSHWLNGTTGEVIPFSSNDDGADIVESSYMAMGLLTVRQYLDPGIPDENQLIGDINDLWHEMNWQWHTRGGEDVLYWHWSPNFEWEKNHKIRGYNEALITYIMAASSPTYPIEAEVYHEGWARNGGLVNGNTYYDILLPLGSSYGGPLFFSHYTYMGIDPRNLGDMYANYWTQGVNHTLINRAYCIANPKRYVSYSEHCWGLTASDGNSGYSAHSPTNDRGVVTPTAALSSFPYTPEESMDALKFFYYKLGDKLWGDYGFYDAFNITEGWIAGSYIAIDQGPIIIMIENYRTQLLWDLFMSAPEVQTGLDKLGFTY